jgi:hypothetical protein
MATSYTNILSAEDINYLNQLPEVLEAKSELDNTTSGKIYFSVNLTESIRNVLTSRFGLDLSGISTIPMRWIKGDTAPHVDVGASKFDHTYLVYLNSTPGELVVDGTMYPILENTGYVFNEGLSHTTHNTGLEPRLMIGPMSEQAFAVGGSPACFLEGSKILCQIDGKDTYIPVEQIRAGTLVKTSRDGYKKVEIIGKADIKNPGTTERLQNRLYKCSPSKYPELKDDLFITGCHSILVNSITDLQREKTIQILNDIFVTDKKYRLMACVDDRAEPWVSEGTYTIWHFALESEHEVGNYGVYANGGLLVETCSLRFLKNFSNMTLV